MLKWRDILRFSQEGNPHALKRVEKSSEQWRKILSEDVYYITRSKGTEHPFSNNACTLFEPGEYACVCCDSLLFNAQEKFDSGSGWPSFTQPATVEAIAYIGDQSHGMQRIEIICNVCDAHLGHVFPDGPKPSGLRYCVNSLSMKKL